MYGYESVRVLAGLIRGDKSVIPEDGFLDIAARQIRKENAVALSRLELNAMLDGKFCQGLKFPHPPLPKPKPQRLLSSPRNCIVLGCGRKGALRAGKDFGVNVEIRMPPSGGRSKSHGSGTVG